MKKVTLIKTNGEESVHEMPKLSMQKMYELANLDNFHDCFDTVNLRDGRIMMVDDGGHRKQRPVNQKATELYHAVCIPGTTHQIRGSVVICNDADWT